MSDTPPQSAVPRKSAFSCEACRKRKVRCNGASPSCSRCSARGETCVYSLAPTLSYTKTLEAKVGELEATVARLRSQLPQDTAEEKRTPRETPAEEFSTPGSTEETDTKADLSREFDGLKLEDDGTVSFHGPTSLFQLPSGLAKESSSSSQAALELDARKERLINNAWRERAFEQLALMPEPFQYLLDSHWCWIQPLFNFVYRPAFTRDLKINGPYYSEVLLNAVLSHSVRWCKGEAKIGQLLDSFDGGAQFFHRAVNGLFETVKHGQSIIPTVQALLLLSAQECGRGNRTQAWLYSGMAFRLIEDLGISIDSRKYSASVQFSDEDVEIRNRLFWSCYFWDKMVSLYFGRSPTMQNSRVSPPRMILDDTSEIEAWTPHGVIFPEGTHYPPAQAHSTSCFMKMCSLSEILNQVLIYIYDPIRQASEGEFEDCVTEQSKALENWWDELPPFLKLVSTDLPPYCPPSHIVTLNCIFHTVNILLHRPILCSRFNRSSNPHTPDTNHLVQCMTSATTILSLYDLYRRTFGDGHVVLSLAYSLYTGASIFLLEIQALKYASPGTTDKLKYCIFALDRVKVSNPVIGSALRLIYQELHKLNLSIPGVPLQQPPPRKSAPQQHPSPQHYGTGSHVSPRSNPSPTPHMTHNVSQASDIRFDMAASQLTDPTHASALGLNPQQISAGLDTGSFEITPEVYEAFSFVEPMTTSVGSEFEAGWGQ